MNFSNFKIGEEDYKFFTSLPKDEKLLFIYDLICDEVYGSGSFFPEDDVFTLDPLDESAPEGQVEKFREFAKANLNYEIDVNIFIIRDQIVLNSNSEKSLNKAIHQMIADGLILRQYELTEKLKYIFHHQKFCRIYILLGREFPLSAN